MDLLKTMTKETIIAFQIGRGGRFYNAGHLSFLGIQKIDETSGYINGCYPPRLEGSEEDDQSPDAEWHDGNGNKVGLTNAMIESGIGIIDFDGDCNTTYTKMIKDVNEQEVKAIINELPDWYAREVLKVVTIFFVNEAMIKDMLTDGRIKAIIQWLDNGYQEEVVIMLSDHASDDINDESDDDVLYYADDIDELISLKDDGNGDFMVIGYMKE